MFASAKAFTRTDLREAFDAFAEAHGCVPATSALERSTGAREVSAVPQGRIINAIVELVGGYSFVGRSATSRAQAAACNLANIHESLAAIGAQVFAKR